MHNAILSPQSYKAHILDGFQMYREYSIIYESIVRPIEAAVLLKLLAICTPCPNQAVWVYY